MNLRLFFSGVLIGGAFGLMIGGAVVRLPADGSGERQYPYGPSMLLAMVGMAGAMSVWRGPRSARPDLAGNVKGSVTAPAEKL